MMNKKGRPDLFMAVIGWHGWLEMKMENGRLSSYQKHWHIEYLKRVRNGVYIARYWPAENEMVVCQLSISGDAREIEVATFPLDRMLAGDEITHHSFFNILYNGLY